MRTFGRAAMAPLRTGRAEANSSASRPRRGSASDGPGNMRRAVAFTSESGNVAAVRRGLTQHLPRLWRVGLVLSGRRDAAEDLVQATCLRALERAEQFQMESRLDRWLMTILHSIWLNDLRSQRIRQGRGFVDAEAVLVTDGLGTAEARVLANETIRQVQSLPEAQRKTVFLAYVEEMTYRETADVLGIPIGTVMSRLAAARAALAAMRGEGAQQ
jgi:RNA polymerase sigma-70 factor (ECF subfamily)